MENAPASGSSTPEPFAYFDRATSSWRMCQASLLEESGESCTTWPRQVTWDRSYAYELRTSALHIFETESLSSLLPTPQTADSTGGRNEKTAAQNGWKRPSGAKAAKSLPTVVSLLPTPSAYESTPTEEYVEEVQANMSDPHERLYLPGRKWHSQRTLSRIVPALLPTPGASDSTGGEGPTREARQEEGQTGGPMLRDIGHLLPTPTVQDSANTAGPSQLERNSEALNVVAAKLLPTPVVTDSFGSRRATAKTEEWESNDGTTLTDALWQVQGRTENTKGGLLPTPTVAAGRKSERAMTSSGAGAGNGKRDGGGMSSPPGLEQVAELTQGIWPRDLPPMSELPPATQEIVRSLWSGESTSPPSEGGNTSSDDPLLDQLTIEVG